MTLESWNRRRQPWRFWHSASESCVSHILTNISLAVARRSQMARQSPTPALHRGPRSHGDGCLAAAGELTKTCLADESLSFDWFRMMDRIDFRCRFVVICNSAESAALWHRGQGRRPRARAAAVVGIGSVITGISY